MSVKYKDENGNLVDLAGMPQQTSFTTDDGTVLNTIDDKLNYLIENVENINPSLFNFNIAAYNNPVNVEINLEKRYLIFTANCTGGATYTTNALRFCILDKGNLIDNWKGSQMDNAIVLTNNTLTFTDQTAYGLAYCIYELH